MRNGASERQSVRELGMARVLVTGGAGYVGSHCCRALRAAGHTPVIIDNLSTGRQQFVEGFELHVGDVRDGTFVRRVLASKPIDATLHFAASTNVGESSSVPEKYCNNNIYGTMCLLDALLELGPAPIIFSSSCAVYGDPEGRPLTEDMPTNPVNPYGFTKLACEQMIAHYAEAYGFRYACLRYSNAAGADPSGEIGEYHDPETHLIPLVLRAILNKGAVSIFGDDYDTKDGTAIRDYVHVCDLGDAHLRALERALKGGENTVINLGSGRGHSVAQVVNEAGSIIGRRVPKKVMPRRRGDPVELVANPTRAGQNLGWIPRRSDLKTIISDAWRWHSGTGLHLDKRRAR